MPYNPPPTRRGYNVSECVSALQKAIRRSQIREAVYWACELYNSEHQTRVWNRLEEICSEDIGPADRYLPATIHALREVSDGKRAKKGGGMEMVHAVILLASAPKSRLASLMVMAVGSDSHPRFEIPDEALDKHTYRGKRMGRDTEHFLTEAAKTIDLNDPELELAQLEREYMAFRREMHNRPRDNPWQSKDRPAKPDTGVKVHQLPGMD